MSDAPLDTQDQRLLKRLMNRYWLHVKSKCMYRKPWRKSEPIETQRPYVHLLKALATAKSLGADPARYVDAQFKHFEIPDKYPYVNQLSGAKARSRWLTYQAECDEHDLVHGDPEGQTLKNDSVKYKSLRRYYTHLSKAAFFQLFAFEFSKAFLQKQGVWSLVQEDWLDCTTDPD